VPEPTAVYRLQCAAITNGCPNAINWPAPASLGMEAAILRAADLLAVNGWHTDHGRWVCGDHPKAARP